MSTPRRRPLKTVTGVSGAVSTYGAAIDPQQSTVASSIEIAKIAEANKFDALFAADLLSFGAQGAIGAQERAVRQLATRVTDVRRCRGTTLDADRVRRIDHAGTYFTVKGPLNIPPLPQRRPVQFQAGQSAACVELGARFAEVVFTSLPTLEDAVTYTKSIRARAAELGRADGLPLIMSSFHATYGASEEEVRRLVREQEEATDLDAGRIRLEECSVAPSTCPGRRSTSRSRPTSCPTSGR